MTAGGDNGRLLILSDGKPGHLNQSLALAGYLGCSYAVVPVGFRSRWLKFLSYLCDWLHLYLPALIRFAAPMPDEARAIVCTGSETYYAAKLLARRFGLPTVATMLPRGYRYDFTWILAQEHDRPPQRSNIVVLPVNLSQVTPRGVFQPQPSKRYVALVVGGPNKLYRFDRDQFQGVVASIFAAFPEHSLVVATSRRTPPAIEELLGKFPFAESFFYSQNPANPIPDLLAVSDYAFITVDSTSMISEAVTFGAANIEIIPLPGSTTQGKYARLLQQLRDLGCVHVFDGRIGAANRKIDLSERLKGLLSCE